MSLAPILLYPAFRYGAATPWGGDQLKTRYGKPAPDTRTGESLEMSVIPGLNSTDAQGTPLSTVSISPRDIPHPPDRESTPTPNRQRNTHTI